MATNSCVEGRCRWGCQVSACGPTCLSEPMPMCYCVFFFFSSRRRHTRCSRDWSSDVCSSDLLRFARLVEGQGMALRVLHRIYPQVRVKENQQHALAAQARLERHPCGCRQFRAAGHGGIDDVAADVEIFSGQRVVPGLRGAAAAGRKAQPDVEVFAYPHVGPAPHGDLLGFKRVEPRLDPAAIFRFEVRSEQCGALPVCRKHALEKRSEEHTSELQSRLHLVCRLLLEKKKISN